MTPVTVAVAQLISIAGDIKANIALHLRFMQTAADHGVQFLVFPELSLTGYERTLARGLAIHAFDSVLNPLRDKAQQFGLVTVVGVPLIGSDAGDIHIGALVFGTEFGADSGADSACGVYTKQHLHAGEEEVFAAGHGGAIITVAENKIALAVCADYTHASHAAQAAQSGAAIYAAGTLLTQNGYAPETVMLAGYAREHRMAVLLANHGGATGGWNPVGRSAIWAEDGHQVIAAPGLGDLLVIAARDENRWSGKVVCV